MPGYPHRETGEFIRQSIRRSKAYGEYFSECLNNPAYESETFRTIRFYDRMVRNPHNANINSSAAAENPHRA